MILCGNKQNKGVFFCSYMCSYVIYAVVIIIQFKA